MSRILFFSLPFLLVLAAEYVESSPLSSSLPPEPPIGDIQQAYDLMGRVLGVNPPFQLELVPKKEDSKSYFELSSPKNDDKVAVLIRGTTVSDITAGIGFYLQNICNMTLGWGAGGSHIILPQNPSLWPRISNCSNHTIRKHRNVPWSYLMNVCTHSYTLVWYDWKAWEQFLDYLALKGVNNILALTGQEEIQYKVLSQIGLSDMEIRSWFNGPAFLTWSRGQNEYGNNIAGPLPRQSWMKAQWSMQKDHILPRLKALGIVGQLPGFQGNVPVQVKTLYPEARITASGDTGWIDSLDQLFGTIADLWMKALVEDFGTQDHWYQMDGYFNGGTAPWFKSMRSESIDNAAPLSSTMDISLEEANESSGSLGLRGMNEERTQELETIVHNETWYRRGAAAYTGLNRTDPDAIWSFQGFSFVGWSTSEQASWLKGFVDSVPRNKFIIIDMSYGSVGEWRQQWSHDNDTGAAFFDASFIWTTLHNFGGVSGIKGDLKQLNQIPFEAFEGNHNIIGSGGTPEGLNQNPFYYEFLFQQPFRTQPISNLTRYFGEFAQKRYNLPATNEDHVVQVWSLLLQSLYSTERSVQDVTAIGHMKVNPSSSLFELNRWTPKPMMCQVYQAWLHLLIAAIKSRVTINAPLSYDVINLGREILAELSIPAALNFSDATENLTNETILEDSANFYSNLLSDVDTLVATNEAFLLGPWLESARRWGTTKEENGSDDCGSEMNCTCFYEWNARTQITTWIPVPDKESCRVNGIPGGPVDYAAKHWTGLISDYYVPRIKIVLEQALVDLKEKNGSVNQTKVNQFLCEHAFEWTRECRNSNKRYPTKIRGDPLKVSFQMWTKYHTWFSTCHETPSLERELRQAFSNLDSLAVG